MLASSACSSSTVKASVEQDGTSPSGACFGLLPYPWSGGTVTCASSPTLMLASARSRPSTTSSAAQDT